VVRVTRLKLALATLVACAFAAFAGATLAQRDSNGDGASAPLGADGFRGALRPEIPPQDFRLRDEEGRPVTLAGLRGEVIVLTFLYTTCEDTCPTAVAQIRGALDTLGHDVPSLAISVDPENDTPDSARRFLLKQRVPNGRVRFLLGDRATLRPIWKAYGIAPQKDEFDHSAYVLLIDRKGRQRIGFPVSQLTPEALAHDIAELEREPA
jgi:protein SCO1/2